MIKTSKKSKPVYRVKLRIFSNRVSKNYERSTFKILKHYSIKLIKFNQRDLTLIKI